ncbi:hypothetical protein GCM10028799_57630 [Kribbella italica]
MRLAIGENLRDRPGYPQHRIEQRCPGHLVVLVAARPGDQLRPVAAIDHDHRLRTVLDRGDDPSTEPLQYRGDIVAVHQPPDLSELLRHRQEVVRHRRLPCCPSVQRMPARQARYTERPPARGLSIHKDADPRWQGRSTLRRLTGIDVHHLVSVGLPGRTIRTVTQLGAGLDNIAYEVNRELVVRIAREPDSVRREGALLARVGEMSPLPVPEPLFVLAEDNCLGYRKVSGTPLIQLPIVDRAPYAASVGSELGRFLTVPQTSGTDRWDGLVSIDDEPPADWRDQAAEHFAEVAEVLTPGPQRRIESFLRAPLPSQAQELAFSHNDLGIEHVLVAPGTGKVTGVIDWSDAAVCDPARDFGLILRDLGPAALDVALGQHPTGGRLRDRARFYAGCSLLEDLHYGLETDRPLYVHKSLNQEPQPAEPKQHLPLTSRARACPRRFVGTASRRQRSKGFT